MKIIGNNEEINIIDLNHNGNNFRFKCFSETFPYMPRTDLQRPMSVEIVFTDLKEVDMLINMLEKFKNNCESYIGIWHENKT